MFPFPTEGLTGQVTGLLTMFTLCFSVTWLRAALSESLGSHTMGSGPAVLRLAWVHPSRISGRIRVRVTQSQHLLLTFAIGYSVLLKYHSAHTYFKLHVICFRHPVEKGVPEAPSSVGWTQLHPTFILDVTKSSFPIFRGPWRILTL